MTNSRLLYIIIFASLLTGCPAKTTTNANGTETKTDTTSVQVIIANFGRERAKQLAKLENPSTPEADKLIINREIDAVDNALSLTADALAQSFVRSLETSRINWELTPPQWNFTFTPEGNINVTTDGPFVLRPVFAPVVTTRPGMVVPPQSGGQP